MNELRVGQATRVGRLTLVPLYRIEANCIEQSDWVWLNGRVDPVAMVFIEPGGMRAVSVAEEELSIEMLLDNVPELATVIRESSEVKSDS